MKALANLHELLQIAVDQGASDLHLIPGAPPILRLFGDITPVGGYDPLDPQAIETAAKQIVPAAVWETLQEQGEVDFPYQLSQMGRFRCSMFRQRGTLALAMRLVATKILPFEQLGLPGVLADVSRRRSGLVLVTGPTGCGKSTTLASMVDLINRERKGVVITLEDPIEYLHSHRRCLVSQREIGVDTTSFAKALRSALRADPDVILVGEMRDLDTIATAITAAETGHLVLSTLHTRGAANTIDRIIDSFPPSQQQQIRIQLSSVLEAVVSQQLLQREDGRGMVPAVEVLLGTPAVHNLIREGKTHQIPSVMETSARFGMRTMDSALDDLRARGLIRIMDADKTSTLARSL